MKKTILLIFAIISLNASAQCLITINGDTAICIGGTTTLTASGSGIYTWTPAIGLNVNTGNVVHATPISTTVYTVTATTGTCTSTNTISILVNPVPTITASSVSVCPGDLISITVVTYPTNTEVTWSNNNTTIGLAAYGSGSPMPSIAPTNTTQASMVAYITYTPSINGCLGSTYTDTIKIKPTPLMKQIPSQYLCPDQYSSPVLFHCIPTPIATDSVLYHWAYNVMGPITSGISNPFPSLGPIPNTDSTSLCSSISVYSTLNGCAGPESTFYICVFPEPTVNFVLQKNTAQVDTWDAYPTYSSNVDSVIWIWGDGTSSTGFYPSHIYNIPGKYNICVTAYSSCGDSATFCQNDSVYRLTNNSNMVYVNVLHSNQVSGIANLGGINKELTVWPNPASKGLSLALSQGEGIVGVNLYDVLGNEVSVGHVELIETSAQLDVSSLNNGVYFVEVRTKVGPCTKKIVIQH